jgi:choline dehydrogenase-like flavoprotein
MVSGVGPRDALEQYDIPIVYENPNVGQNMMDHVWFGPAVRVNLETASRWNNDPEYLRSVYEAYWENQEGPLTSNGGDFGAFEKIPEDLRKGFTKQALEDLAEYPDDWPDVEVRWYRPTSDRWACWGCMNIRDTKRVGLPYSMLLRRHFWVISELPNRMMAISTPLSPQH